MDLLSQPFVKAILDPALIPEVYLHCDQWCMYCPLTSRCLAYRCRPADATDDERQDIWENIAARLYEAVECVKAVTGAEGEPRPELVALTAADPRRLAVYQPVNDQLEKMARRYAIMSTGYLVSRADYPFVMKRRPEGPLPLEVFAWFHVQIAAKIYRALMSSAASARGDARAGADAQGSVKAALLGIDRSRAAIQVMQQDDSDARLDEMAAHLRRLTRELEARFPDARGFVRAGLDAPPSA
jgi:hypothetical protein